jgi:hypothetical protein
VGLLSIQRASSYREDGAVSSKPESRTRAAVYNERGARREEVSRMAKGKNMQKEKKKPKKTKK